MNIAHAVRLTHDPSSRNSSAAVQVEKYTASKSLVVMPALARRTTAGFRNPLKSAGACTGTTTASASLTLARPDEQWSYNKAGTGAQPALIEINREMALDDLPRALYRDSPDGQACCPRQR